MKKELTTQERIGIGQCYNLAVEILKHNAESSIISCDKHEESLKYLTKKLYVIKTNIEKEILKDINENEI